jgi:hypothetical protein
MQRRQTIVVEGCLWVCHRVGMRRGWLFRRRGWSTRRNRDRHAACHGVEAVDLAVEQPLVERNVRPVPLRGDNGRWLQIMVVLNAGESRYSRGWKCGGECEGGCLGCPLMSHDGPHWPESRLTSFSIFLASILHHPSSAHHPIIPSYHMTTLR